MSKRSIRIVLLLASIFPPNSLAACRLGPTWLKDAVFLFHLMHESEETEALLLMVLLMAVPKQLGRHARYVAGEIWCQTLVMGPETLLPQAI